MQNFRTKFFIVAPEKHYEKYCRTIEMDVYNPHRYRFEFLTYDKLTETYNNTVGGAKEIGWLL
ncbi:MAG: hypothetical protein IJ722_04800 [Alloprevotella sp.]|nr:hypothetical protein [Alloprevotella sp.]